MMMTTTRVATAALLSSIILQCATAGNNAADRGLFYKIYLEDNHYHGAVAESLELVDTDPIILDCFTDDQPQEGADVTPVKLHCPDAEHDHKYALHLHSRYETNDGDTYLVYPNPFGTDVEVHQHDGPEVVLGEVGGGKDDSAHETGPVQALQSELSDDVSDLHDNAVDYVEGMSDCLFIVMILGIVVAVGFLVFAIVRCIQRRRRQLRLDSLVGNTNTVKDDATVNMWSTNDHESMNNSFGNLHEIDLDASARMEEEFDDERKEDTFKYWNIRFDK